MSFFKTSKKAEDVKSGGTNYIVKSGVYPVGLMAPVVSVSEKGSTTVDMFVDHNGQKQMVYGNLRITNNDGTPNKIGSRTFNQLLVIAGLDEVADPVEVELPIGKNGAEKSVSALEDLADIDVLMHVQMEYAIWNGDIQERKVIRGFYRTDKASAEEIVNNTTVGENYEKSTKYFNNITYKDELTEEAVNKWIAAGRPKGTGGEVSDNDAPAPSFGKKRFGK